MPRMCNVCDGWVIIMGMVLALALGLVLIFVWVLYGFCMGIWDFVWGGGLGRAPGPAFPPGLGDHLPTVVANRLSRRKNERSSTGTT